MHAYNELYLSRAMQHLADMFDHAVNEIGLKSEDYVQMFICSDICRKLEIGEPKYLLGMCGEEIADRVIEEATGIEPETEITERLFRTPDHWCGWVIAYYQWLRAIPYREIFRTLPYEKILALYPTLHEADVSKFAAVMDDIRSRNRRETNLKRIRTAYGCSQSELARMSGVSIRSIQMYEQRKKDINKGGLAAVLNLARALGCRAEDLLEA